MNRGEAERIERRVPATRHVCCDAGVPEAQGGCTEPACYVGRALGGSGDMSGGTVKSVITQGFQWRLRWRGAGVGYRPVRNIVGVVVCRRGQVVERASVSIVGVSLSLRWTPVGRGFYLLRWLVPCLC